MAKKQAAKAKGEEQQERWVVIMVNQDGVTRVFPGRRHARRGDTVAFEVVNTMAEIKFRKSHPFTTTKLGPHEIDRRGWSCVRFKVKKSAKIGEYPYTVKCKRTKKNALGDSEPRMIIDN